MDGTVCYIIIQLAVYKLQYDNTILLEGMSTRYNISDCCDLNLEYSGVQVYVVTRRVVDTVL